MKHLVFAAALLLVGALGGAAAQTLPEPGAIHVIEVKQAITAATTSYVERALERATIARAGCLVIQLDTPGGLLNATRDIVQLLLNTRVPVVVYISPSGARGASAGTMITLASHVAAMAPATHIGAAHPVALFGMGGDNKVMGEKILNDTSAYVQGIAELRGRNTEWAISAVRESKSITAQQALKLKVIEIVAENLTDLVSKLDGRTVKFSSTESVVLDTRTKPLIYQDMSFSQEMLSLLSNPNLVFLLLIIGLVGLYVEVSNPGLFFPGILGAISLLIALTGMQTLPVNYGAFALMLLGMGLLVAEAFVPSFGILGIGGLASILIGAMFLLDAEATELRIALPVIISGVATTGIISLVIGRLLVTSFRMSPISFQDNMVGRRATVREAIKPGQQGLVVLNGELWKATATEKLTQGEAVVVAKAEGLLLTVAKAAPPTGTGN